MRLFISLLLFALSLGFSAVAYLELPAVSEDGDATLVNISVESRPGTGDVYVSISPFAGEEFQQSVQSSFNYVRPRYNLSNTDFLIRSNAGEKALLLDGPSAGAAIAMMMQSLAEGRPLRQDLTITGGITPEGSIIPVGGLPEKAGAAADAGKKAILVPVSSPEDSAMLDRISLEKGVRVAHYSSLADAYSIFTSGKHELPAQNITYPVVRYSSADGLPRVEPNVKFSPSVKKMINQLAGSVGRIRHTYPEAYSYFSAKLGLAESLYEKGYTYSAGNEAFLALTRAYALEAGAAEENISSLYDDVRSCLGRVERNLHDYKGSAEDYANAELRYYWAANVVEGINLPGSTLPMRLENAYRLRQAQLWCMIAEDLSSNARAGAVPLSVSRLKAVDEMLLHKYLMSEGEHLAKGAGAYARGYYGAALLELSMHESEVNTSYDEDVGKNYTSSWARMMQAHASYLSFNPEYGNSSAASIRKFAMAFSRNLAMAFNGKEGSEGTVIIAGNAGGGDGSVSRPGISELTLLILLCIFILAILAHVLLRRKWGGNKKWKARASL
ncbi:MAG: hypothetical protein N3G76_01160 [Candidatus Micrarchaeota archaeon]|nr:hypothetical protein [Candidatus Micrarchaeota archaeon]